MLSRVAERTYWLARYLERTEVTARLLLVRHLASLDLPREAQPQWSSLLDVLSVRQQFEALPGKDTEDNVVRFLFIDRDNPSSIISSLTGVRENMRTTREVLPSEAWEQANSLYLSVARRSSKGLPRSMRHNVLNSIIRACQQITGMLSGTMSHDTAYQFLKIGRMLERVDMCSRFLDVGTEELLSGGQQYLPYQNVLWISVLESLSAHQMYRLSMQSNVNPIEVIRFLVKDENFPRALAFSVNELKVSMSRLPSPAEALKPVTTAGRRLERYRLGKSSEEQAPDTLHKFLDEVQRDMQKVHTAIDRTWFHPEL